MVIYINESAHIRSVEVIADQHTHELEEEWRNEGFKIIARIDVDRLLSLRERQLFKALLELFQDPQNMRMTSDDTPMGVIEKIILGAYNEGMHQRIEEKDAPKGGRQRRSRT